MRAFYSFRVIESAWPCESRAINPNRTTTYRFFGRRERNAAANKKASVVGSGMGAESENPEPKPLLEKLLTKVPLKNVFAGIVDDAD